MPKAWPIELAIEALSGLESHGFIPFVSSPPLGHALWPLCGPGPWPYTLMHGAKVRSQLLQGGLARPSPTRPCIPERMAARAHDHSLTSLDTEQPRAWELVFFLQLLFFHLFHHVKHSTLSGRHEYLNSLSPHVVTRMGENLLTMQETWAQSLSWGDPVEKETAALSSVLARESRGQRSLAGYIPWGHKEVDTPE